VRWAGRGRAFFFSLFSFKIIYMKAIKIKAELKNHFLQAANHLGLKVVQLKTIEEEGHLYFPVEGHVSQDDIFKLGYLFSKLLNQKIQ
jgi:hypothetical protein